LFDPLKTVFLLFVFVIVTNGDAFWVGVYSGESGSAFDGLYTYREGVYSAEGEYSIFVGAVEPRLVFEYEGEYTGERPVTLL